MTSVSARARELVGPRAVTRLRCLLRGYPVPRWGNLRRVKPFSTHYGFERGTPIDRHYLHAFLARHADLITGRVLEVQTTGYTQRFGRNVRRAESFDIVTDSRPTYVCDLARSENVLPSGAFDCLLLPNTLQHLRDLDDCLHHALRVVRPGGSILATAAGFVPLTSDVADYWRLSPEGWRTVLGRAWAGADVSVEGHGNCLAAAAAQFGIAVEELTAGELDVQDARYPVLTTIHCRRVS